MFLILLSLLGGLVFLTLGAEGLVRGSVATGKNLKVSPLLMGLTVVAFGTSSPELMASLQSAFAGSPGIAIGNVVGSNIFNICVILGLAAIVSKNLPLTRTLWKRDALTMFASTLLLTAVLQFMPVLTRPMGLGFLLLLAGYIYLIHGAEKKLPQPTLPDEITTTPRLHMLVSLALVAAGLIGLVIGANLLVNAAVALAKLWGYSETVIGLTIVACGTSLPELAATIAAVRNKQTDMAIGGIVGSNIFNIFGILGVTSLLLPISVSAQLKQDGWIMLAVTTVFVLFSRAGLRLGRPEGILLLLAFGVYLWHLLG